MSVCNKIRTPVMMSDIRVTDPVHAYDEHRQLLFPSYEICVTCGSSMTRRYLIKCPSRAKANPAPETRTLSPGRPVWKLSGKIRQKCSRDKCRSYVVVHAWHVFFFALSMLVLTTTHLLTGPGCAAGFRTRLRSSTISQQLVNLSAWPIMNWFWFSFPSPQAVSAFSDGHLSVLTVAWRAVS